MQYKNAAIIVAGLVAQQAVAFGWTDANAYSCPGNTNNHCSGSQQGGYDWSGLQTGSFNSYGSNSFSGFTCSSSFGKRDLLSKRGFQAKCITGDLDSTPSISCSNDDTFSIDTMQVSSSQDTEIDCVYGMPDGSTCHETHSCSEGGSIFQNSQCGGAKSVTFKPGKNAPPGCSIGVHHVGFHCGPPASTVPASVPSTSAYVPPASSSSPSYGCTGPQCTSSSPPGCSGYGCSSSVPTPVSSSPVPSCSGANCGTSSAPTPGCYGGTCSSSVVSQSSSAPTPGCYGGTCSTSATPSSSPVPACSGSSCSSSAPAPGCYGGSCTTSVQPASSSAPAPSCYGASCSSSTQGIPGYGSSSSPVAPVSSSTQGIPSYGSTSTPVTSSSPVAPVSSSTQGIPSYGSTSSPVAPVSSSTQGIPSYGSTTSPVAPVSSSTAPGPYPTPNCPGTLPRCLNTWMYLAGCKNNADSNCFCGNSEFIKKVMGCISAWSGSDSETQAAASYLMGLCAQHVSTNPAIITACPSTITPGPSPAAYTPSSVGAVTSAPPPPPAGGKPAPCTTITYSSSVVVPATYTTGVSSGLTCPSSSFTTTLVTTVTVPQVQLTTSTYTTGGTTSSSVGLGAGSPSPVPAYTTPAASSAGATGTTLGTTWATTPTASSSPIIPATGEGVKTSFSLITLLLGAVAAVAVL